MTRLLHATLTLLLLAPVVCAQGQIRWWTKDFDEALDHAKDRNVPLVIVYIQDGEEANERLEKSLFASKDFVNAANSIVPMIASHTDHRPTKAKGTGPNRSVCSKFRYCTCRQHKRIEIQARGEFWPDGIVKTPAVIVFKPDLTETKRIIDVFPVTDYVAAIRAAKRDMGPGLTADQHQQLIVAAARVKQALDDQNVAKALVQIERMRALPNGPAVKREMDRYAKRVAARKANLLDQMKERVAAGDHLGTLRDVLQLKDALSKTPFAKELAKLEKDIKRTREGKAAERVLKAEGRAKPILEKARDSWRKRDYKGAVKAWYQVLGRVPAGPLHDEAKSAIEDVRADKDIAKLVQKELDEGAAAQLFAEARPLRRKEPARYTELLETILEKYPNTAVARRARKALGR